MSIFILFSHQLFHPKIIKKVTKDHQIYLIEDPILCGDRPNMKLNLNKLRLAYQRYLQELYIENLSSNESFGNIKFIKCTESPPSFKNKQIRMFDPIDNDLLHKWLQLYPNIEVLDSPWFILTNKESADYFKSLNGKHLRHAPFYKFMKEKLNILKNVESQDKYNRKPYPKSAPPPPQPYPNYTRSKKEKELLTHCITWAESINAPDYSTPAEKYDILIALPNSHKEANTWLKKFLNDRFDNFGLYEDAIVANQQWMFHSGLSIPLNYGLLTPLHIIEAAMEYKNKVPMESFEAFIRQIIGWREYCRVYYHNIPRAVYNKNHFGFTKRALPEKWYTGKTGIQIVDDTIKDAWRYGYLHHIRRLMVMANYMTLCRIHPDNIYKWMYEFSLDSNDVYMVFNCYSMGSYGDGGLATYKPYISGSNYIKKQSHYDVEEEWDEKYNSLKN